MNTATENNQSVIVNVDSGTVAVEEKRTIQTELLDERRRRLMYQSGWKIKIIEKMMITWERDDDD